MTTTTTEPPTTTPEPPGSPAASPAPSPPPQPRWLVPAGSAVVALIALSALWAVVIVLMNWSRIGV